MDEAAATRRAALDAVDDVQPAELQDRLVARLTEVSMVPGVLTILSARASSDGTALAGTDGGLREPLARRAAGVQLVYDGLDRTRKLAHDEPWGRESQNGETAANVDADLDILVADVLVARGFHLLARTPAADQAVRTVQAFGRDQTVLRSTGDSTLDATLETDVLELAVVAGATLGETGPGPGLREFAAELATRLESSGGFPATAEFLPDNVDERLQTLVTDVSRGEGVTTSVDD